MVALSICQRLELPWTPATATHIAALLFSSEDLDAVGGVSATPRVSGTLPPKETHEKLAARLTSTRPELLPEPMRAVAVAENRSRGVLPVYTVSGRAT